ncbi:MAG: MBL fold metallo-hydrolase [Methanocorpusculum sp.]|nr:MBL fold metallo-hydrolase [Methanocorpusculum sp.]
MEKITSSEALAEIISASCSLSEADRNKLANNAEIIRKNLCAINEPHEKTFSYILTYADFLKECKGSGYVTRIASRDIKGIKLWSIEPPCGSTTYILDFDKSLLAVDAGYPCYKEELHNVILKIIPDFDTREKDLILTHMDMDHCGLLSVFDNIFMSRTTYENFVRKRKGEDDLREANHTRAPFYRISSILCDDIAPDTSNMKALNTAEPDLSKPLSFIGNRDFSGFIFEFYETSGGHVDGSIVFLCRELELIFTGDTLINTADLTDGQKEFNKFAPYVIRSVNQDSKKALLERQEVYNLIGDKGWIVCGGHGACFNNPQKE